MDIVIIFGVGLSTSNDVRIMRQMELLSRLKTIFKKNCLDLNHNIPNARFTMLKLCTANTTTTSSEEPSRFIVCPDIPSSEYGPQCDYQPADWSLLCSGGVGSTYQIGNSRVKSLTLCHWPETTFDPTILATMFPSLQQFALTSGNISRLTSDFPHLHVEVLNMSSLQLTHLDDTTFSQLRNLRILDLRFNLLKQIEPDAISQLPYLHIVYLAGNPWNCSDGSLMWLLDVEDSNGTVARRIADRDKMLCCNEVYREKPVISVMTFLQTLQYQCPREPDMNCSCSLPYVTRAMTGDELIPIITVDCSNQGLKQFPPNLPNHTTTLIMSGNEISNLEPLVKNSDYRDVKDVYLDKNKVESISVLEGSYWLMHFRLLSLKSNLLTQIPTYALDNALMKNKQASTVFLGDNPWKCDCYFTPDFQDLLGKYLKIFKDETDIRCTSLEDDENSYLPILQLSRFTLCTPPADYNIRPLDFVNGILALLIVLVVGKLAYDYWWFKRTGKVPWIVTKMP